MLKISCEYFTSLASFQLSHWSKLIGVVREMIYQLGSEMGCLLIPKMLPWKQMFTGRKQQYHEESYTYYLSMYTDMVDETSNI